MIVQSLSSRWYKYRDETKHGNFPVQGNVNAEFHPTLKKTKNYG